jgi:hypothetical protein
MMQELHVELPDVATSVFWLFHFLFSTFSFIRFIYNCYSSVLYFILYIAMN